MNIRIGAINYAGARAVATEVGVNAARVMGSNLRDFARDTHRDSRRGGRNLNIWGERRSKRKEPPAMEWGVLWASIDQSGTDTPTGYSFMVNYAELEFWYERPLGAITTVYAHAMRERLL